MKRALALSALAAILLFPSSGRRLGAADFRRGDANDDGFVSVADAHLILTFLFRTGEGVVCGDAADVDNSGQLELTDAIHLLRYVTFGDEAPAAPFPDPGPDDGFEPDIDGRWPCDAYGNGNPLEDPSAALRVLDAVAPGGEDRHAVVVLAVSNATRLAGYYAELATAGVIADRSLAEADLDDGVFDLSGSMAVGFLGVLSDAEAETLRISYLTSAVGDVAIPPRDDQAVLEVELCLEPGTPAGEYPLALRAGELVDFDSARRIEPALVSGTLTVLEDIREPECVIPPSDPHTRTFLHVTFELEEATATPGSEVIVPLVVRASDHASTHGLTVSVDFDEEILQLAGVETALERPDGQPWSRTNTFANNDNDHPGNAGLDEGYIAGRYIYASYFNEELRFPVNEEFTALALRFAVSPDAPVGVTEVRFEDGGEACRERSNGTTFCWNQRNEILSGQLGLSPGLIDSFIFVNGRVNIVGEVTVFIRGDANGDRTVDLSDAQFTLGYLFLGGETVSCLDAADANDDGQLNVSDPIVTLMHLFLGGPAPPPPNGTPGEDPTTDGLNCVFGTL